MSKPSEWELEAIYFFSRMSIDEMMKWIDTYWFKSKRHADINVMLSPNCGQKGVK